MSYNIYYILGALLIIYLLITMANKKAAKKRKSRRFMEGYKRKEGGAKTDHTESGKEPKN